MRLLLSLFALVLGTGSLFAQQAPPAESWQKHIFPAGLVNQWAADASFGQAKARTDVATLSKARVSLMSSDISTPTVLFATTSDGTPVRFRFPSAAIVWVLSQPGVVTCEITPIYDSAADRTSIAVIGRKADGSTAVYSADAATTCPPFCGGGSDPDPTKP